MVSSACFQLATVIRNDDQPRLVHISWPRPSFWAWQGWIVVLQGVLSLVLALVFFVAGPSEQVKQWARRQTTLPPASLWCSPEWCSPASSGRGDFCLERALWRRFIRLRRSRGSRLAQTVWVWGWSPGHHDRPVLCRWSAGSSVSLIHSCGGAGGLCLLFGGRRPAAAGKTRSSMTRRYGRGLSFLR